MNETPMVNGSPVAATAPTHAKKTSPRKPAAMSAKPKKGKAKKRAAAAAPKKKASKARPAKKSRGGAMAKQGRYVLVIHMSKELQVKLDRAIKGTDESRSSYCRKLVEKRLG